MSTIQVSILGEPPMPIESTSVISAPDARTGIESHARAGCIRGTAGFRTVEHDDPNGGRDPSRGRRHSTGPCPAKGSTARLLPFVTAQGGLRQIGREADDSTIPGDHRVPLDTVTRSATVML